MGMSHVAPDEVVGDSRAAQTLRLLLKGIVENAGYEPNEVEVHEAWVEADDVFCLVYDLPLHGSRRMGLRRDVDEGWTPDEVAGAVLVGELLEPLGTLADALVERDGVWWWEGDEPSRRMPYSLE
ncbi:hypothetical protein [Nocardioides yefusunii]|uniref:Uncharacterized protein n=1 Tax=Nocardioides yefusunii TaxID=2500546 RepID=A0ABW1QX85_9ACTN|nr:hypothetical protein [Nocardioides yefusunii]